MNQVVVDDKVVERAYDFSKTTPYSYENVAWAYGMVGYEITEVTLKYTMKHALPFPSDFFIALAVEKG